MLEPRLRVIALARTSRCETTGAAVRLLPLRLVRFFAHLFFVGNESPRFRSTLPFPMAGQKNKLTRGLAELRDR